ncbi:MAG: S8 family serine peptidase [Thermoplasmata archaeon]|nr:MAG: S8 family serine peptidase [Thermoplasmata archaeon]
MSRRPRRHWYLAIALISLMVLATTAGAANVPGPATYRLASVSGVTPGDVPTYEAPEVRGAAPWYETTSMDADRDGMFDMLDTLVDAGSLEPVDVLVDLDRTPTEDDARAIAAVVDAPGWALFPALKIVGLRDVRPQSLELLLQVPGVLMLEPRVDAVPFQDVATRALKVQPSDEYSPNTTWELGYTGNGVVISIMDTGVDDAHSALRGKFVAGADFTKPERPNLFPRDGTYNPDDQGGHGTTCAGISMSTGAPGGDYIGAAPDASLVDLRIGTRFGFSPGELPQNSYDAALQAIDWAASHSYTQWPGGEQGVDINSLSWGIPYDGPSDGSDAYSRGLDQCVLEGIVSCVAAGNEGPSNNGITGMSASTRSIIVGALDDQNTIHRADDVVATYSSRGPRDDDHDDYPYDELKPDVTAPGTNINGVVYENRGDGSGGGYGGRGSGTSYATPYVAGVAALMLEANPDLSPDVLREILRATAERRGEPMFPTLDPYWDNYFGWGMVDGYNATRVALDLGDNMEIYDVELQAFVTNITGGSGGDPLMHVEGIAWARVGMIEAVEWRLDGGNWHTVSARDGQPTFTIDPAMVGEGHHVLEVRAVGANGKVSVWRPVDFEVTQEAVDASVAAAGGGGLGWCVAAVVVVAIAGFFLYRYKPEYIEKGMSYIPIQRKKRDG